MKEGDTPLPLFYCRKRTVRAARIVAVDHALGQVIVRLTEGRHEMRYGTREMFMPSSRPPQPGDYLVDYDGGARAVCPPEIFERVYCWEAEHVPE